MAIADAADRLRDYVRKLIDLLREYGIRSIGALIRAVRSDPEFRAKWTRIWKDIADAEGGKVSLGVAGAILGKTLGGVGIAWGGMAIGLPLIFLLGLGGFLAGAEVDAVRRLARHRVIWLRLPKALYERIRNAAELSGISVRELILRTLIAAFPDPDELRQTADLDEPDDEAEPGEPDDRADQDEPGDQEPKEGDDPDDPKTDA
jgi:hypothetical protein